jgi:tetratricopeptide (TPR) repeat protein
MSSTRRSDVSRRGRAEHDADSLGISIWGENKAWLAVERSVRSFSAMRPKLLSCIVRILVLAAVSYGLVTGLTHEANAQETDSPKPQPPARGAQSSARMLNESIPDSAIERGRLLDDLYAHLAAAEDERAAERVAEAIARLWRASGGDTAKVLMERADKALNDKQHALALHLLEAVVALAPDCAEAWSQRAQVLFRENELERALGDLRRALALDPNHFKALHTLAHILLETGQKKGALRAYEKLLEVHPFWPGARQARDELSREVGGQRT